MKIQIIDDKTVKISLTLQDMQKLGLTYEQMDYNDLATRKAILKILREIRTETNLDIGSGKLFIEAFPECTGGCVLYVNLLPSQTTRKEIAERQSFDTPLIFRFENIDLVTAVSKRLLLEYNHLIIHSSLYFMEGCYCLLLYTYCRMEEKIISILQEYGTFLGKGSILSAFVKEHGQNVLDNEAIETITKYIG